MSSFSVVVPNYNYGRYLDSCLNSILSQQVDLRVLLIDNASTDDSVSIAERIARRDPRVTIRCHEKNLGLIASLNEGVAWASGTYFAQVSSDDRLTPGALDRAGALLDAHPRVGFVYGRPVQFADDASLPKARSRSGGWSVRAGQAWLARRCREAHSVLSQPEATARTSLVHEMGGYDSRLPHTSDLEYFLRLAARADVGYLRGSDQAFYRVHGSNMSSGYYKGYLGDLQGRWDAFSSLVEKDAALLADAERLQQAAAKTLAREALWRLCRAYDKRTVGLPAEELEAFAYRIYPRADTLREHRALELRRRSKSYAELVRRAPAEAALRRGRYELWQRRWQLNGE